MHRGTLNYCQQGNELTQTGTGSVSRHRRERSCLVEQATLCCCPEGLVFRCIRSHTASHYAVSPSLQLRGMFRTVQLLELPLCFAPRGADLSNTSQCTRAGLRLM